MRVLINSARKKTTIKTAIDVCVRQQEVHLQAVDFQLYCLMKWHVCACRGDTMT